jgi:hypothetical protein
VDITKPCDADALTTTLTVATHAATTLKTQRDAYAEAKRAAEEARAKVAAAKPDVSAEQAKADRTTAFNEWKQAEGVLRQLLEQVKEAETRLASAAVTLNAADRVLRSAQQGEEALAGWKAQIESFERLPQPDADAIAAADAACQAAREAVDDGAVVRMAKSRLADAERYSAQAKEYRDVATHLREQAAAVFQVLSQQIPPGPLRVEAGELVIDTADRKAEPFDRLSEGEKSKVAVEYAINAVGDGGIACLPQHFWDGLSVSSKAWVHRLATDKGAIVIVGEIAEGDLRVEPFAASA